MLFAGQNHLFDIFPCFSVTCGKTYQKSAKILPKIPGKGKQLAFWFCSLTLVDTKMLVNSWGKCYSVSVCISVFTIESSLWIHINIYVICSHENVESSHVENQIVGTLLLFRNATATGL